MGFIIIIIITFLHCFNYTDVCLVLVIQQNLQFLQLKPKTRVEGLHPAVGDVGDVGDVTRLLLALITLMVQVSSTSITAPHQTDTLVHIHLHTCRHTRTHTRTPTIDMVCIYWYDMNIIHPRK